jgi:hypothetical protein
MYFLHMYEYGILKPVKATLRRRWGKRENNRGDEPNWGTLYAEMELSGQTPLYNYYGLIKLFKNEVYISSCLLVSWHDLKVYIP